MIRYILTLIATVSISNYSMAQANADMYLSGRWNASCPVEVLDHASMRNCDLCPFVINPNDKRKGEIKNIEIIFQTDSLKIDQHGKISVVPYSRNKETHAISFSLNNKLYNFRIFIDGERRILEDNDGMLLVLEKAK